MTLQEIDKAMAEAHDKACEIQALADAEKRHLSEDEQTDLETALAEFAKLKGQRTLRAQVEANTRIIKGEVDDDDKPSNRVVRNDAFTPVDDKRGTRTPVRVTDRGANDPKWGFRSTGEYMSAVVQAGRSRGQSIDPRLTRALSTYGSEGSGPDGGYAVPPDFLNRIVDGIEGGAKVWARVMKIPVSGNSLTIPTNENPPWSTSGPQAYWTGEAGTITQSKPNLKQVNIPLHKLACLVPLTEELMEDSTALDAWTMQDVTKKMSFKLDLAVVQGTGAGQPLGLLNSSALTSIAKEASQTADTINGANVAKMYQAMLSDWLEGAVWLAQDDCKAQFIRMYDVDQEGTQLSTWPVMLPQAGGFSVQPYGALFGKEIIYTQACETVGDKGDIFFFSPNQYIGVTKQGGLRATQSIHFWFDQDTTALKATMRVGGQPLYGATVSARDGSNTFSPYISLDARA
jgi:HK97 family phage major capsid protein